MKGGFRENSGRKKGFSAIQAEKSREYIVRQVEEALKPIVDSLIERAKKGDLKATQILFDRAFGRPVTPVEAKIDESPRISLILDELEDYGKYDQLYNQQKS